MDQSQINLIQHFKSVAVMLHPNDAGDDYQLNSQQLVDWFVQFDEWFKDVAGITEGFRPYTLYSRQISLFGSDLLSLPDPFKELAKTTINRGYAVSITVEIEELFHHFNTIEALCKESLISSIGVIIEGLDSFAEKVPLENFISKMIDLKRPIGLIGSVSQLRKYNLLNLTSLNGTDLTIYPLPAADPSNESPIAPVNPVSPCANRLQLYIDQDGHIYPCMGLLGLTEYAMGHITDDILETALAFSKQNYKLDLHQLMREGPKLSNSETNPKMQTNLPKVCELHREELLANA